MKRLALFFMAVNLITFALEVEDEAVNTYKDITQSNENDKSVSVIWSEDFGNGFPANWTRTTTNTSGGNATCNWVWSDDGSWGNFSGGGTSSADAALNSTTANNGFLISDIDSANHFVNGQPSGSTYEYIDSYFTTEAISTLGFTSVTLEFEHSSGRLNDHII